MKVIVYMIVACCLLCVGCGLLESEEPPEADRQPSPAVKVEFRPAWNTPEPGLTPMKTTDTGQEIHIGEEVLMTNTHIASASARPDEYGQYTIEIVLTQEGRAKFAEITAESVGRPLAIFLDGRLVSAPVVQERIDSDRALIHGIENREEAERLARGIGGGR